MADELTDSQKLYQEKGIVSILDNLDEVQYLELKDDETGFAYNALNAFLNDTLGVALGGYSKNSFQNYVNTMRGNFKGRRKRTEKDTVQMVDATCDALLKFLQQFFIAYLKYAPYPEKSPYSEGNYLRSSIIYFSGDERSKQIALNRVGNPVVASDGFMHGDSYVLNVLRMRGSDTVDLRVKLISGGLSLENLAQNEQWFYGWKNVENDGWVSSKTGKTTPPYSPFKYALQEATKTFILNGYKISIKYKAHNVRGSYKWNKKK